MKSSSPFSVSQWQELEHQALIFKYIIAGLHVPPDLMVPIQKSFENISHRFFNHPSLSYCSLYGKKIDPEPGRCRRTDGKKWRCSKEAHPNSKYCERHMHRGRNRSRKPVESSVQTNKTSTYSSPLSSSVTSSSFPGGGNAANYQSLPLHSFGNMQPAAASLNHNQSTYNMDSIPFGIPSKDYRYMQVQEGLKPESVEHSFFSGASGSDRRAQTSLLENNTTWPVMLSSLHNSCAQTSSFLDIDFASRETTKQDGQPLRPFFDEWPKARAPWSGLEDDRSNQTSYSTTQLSISTPVVSSDLSAANSHSPHDT
ncbi:PREDICTED: growth-regulating factor 4-like isoform X2 [Tarenaya hassleriana]|uniref:growth-regulating factor 4-like isoform X2 n=1 Tax=Tarenaya hassleriana TaxID=28532 RepID=UPI00053C1772|nr:PREDICTED: growth-regulating factor 4-like isoform X2 [Tarenaya hassleriana]